MKSLERKKKLQKLIIKSARKIAKEEGWNSLTMRRIAKEIGFSLPIIYRNFENKDAIISFLANKGFVELRERVVKVMKKKFKTPSKLIWNVIKEYWSFYIQKPEIYSVMYGLEGQTFESPEPLVEARKLFFVVQEGIQELIDKHGAKIENSSIATEIIWSGIHGFISLSSMQKIEKSERRSKEILSTYFEYIIKAWDID